MGPRSKEELHSLAVIAPEMEAELTKNPLRDPQPTDPYFGKQDFFAAREHRATVLRERFHQRIIPGPIPEVEEQHIRVTARDGTEIAVIVYKPVHPPASGSPLIFMIHEGAWCMGDVSDEFVNCRMFTRDLGAVCLNVDYRLAPEYPHPTGINDCWDVLQWAAKNASSLGADVARGFLIGGCSAGANYTATLAHLARDNNLSPPLTGQYMSVPAIINLPPPETVPEPYRSEYLSHPAVTPNFDAVLKPSAPDPMDWVRGVLQARQDDPLWTPWCFGETERGHRDLPPAYFQICGMDPLRDEGLIYERVLREEAGVATKLDVYPGYPHCFWNYFPELKMSRKYSEDTLEGVKWLLAQKSRHT